MLQGINRIGRSWVGRLVVAVLFGLLIVSFAIWGIGDVFRGAVRSQVATVGGLDITAEAFRTAYQSEFQNLVRRARRNITADQARALGLEQRVLARLVSDAAFDHETRRLGLQIPDELVIRSIQADPSFKSITGNFDRSIFLELLRQTGMSEAQFVREQKALLARQQVSESLTGALAPPLAMREAVHRFQSERRSVEYVKLGAAALGEVAIPSDAQLQSFYDERKAAYRAPETRAFAYMTLDAAALAKPDAVSEVDARAQYARVKDSRFGQPERRVVQQIIFPTKGDAAAAADRIKAGTSFDTIAQERGIDAATLNLGTLTRGEMLDPVTADAAFALPEGGVSASLDGRFGPVLVHVTRIEPGSLKPFEEVAAEIRAEVARERARAEVQTVHDAIEDERAGAKPLPEIARQRGLTLAQVASLDRTGLDVSGQPVAGLPEREALLAAVFRSEVGADSEAVSTRDGGYVWFDVSAITPAKDRPLAEVKDRTVEDWRRQEVSRGLADRARALVERIDKGEPLSAVAGELGQSVVTETDLASAQPKGDLSTIVTTRIFAIPVGKASSAAPDDDSRILFKVTGATLPPFVTTTQESAAVEGQLRTLFADDVLAEYLADVEKRIGVQLYPANMRRAIGGES